MPSDMKWSIKFSGDLSNAATYPNQFANVNRKEGLLWEMAQEMNGDVVLIVLQCRLLTKLHSLSSNRKTNNCISNANFPQ